MSSNNYPHEDKQGFQAAVFETAKSSGFAAPLVEKDYYCSLILKKIYADADNQIIFKGGTLLNKVYMGFYRLSEDLDFSIPVSPNSSRKDRSNKAKPFKARVEEIANDIPGLKLARPLSGSNNSTQYNAQIEYDSPISAGFGTILFEIGLREETLLPPEKQQAGTLVTSPIDDERLIEPFNVICLSQAEAYAEKLRAALARLKPAIRDLFDVDYALKNDGLKPDSPEFKELLKIKLTSPTKRVIDLSDDKRESLRNQLITDLRPVMREQDFDSFEIESAWQSLCEIGKEYV